jgi:hypothetical protein
MVSRGGLAEFQRRTSTTSKPRRSNIDCVPWYALAAGMRLRSAAAG